MNSAQKNSAKIYTVALLTREIKNLLENRYPFLWITGEVSNYVTPASGHSYFSLKDADAVISCVMFKNQKRNLRFVPENGMKVKGMARISLYEPRGNYQLIFEHMEPDGAGSLQQAFEELKQTLSARGWFDTDRKKEIPFLPQRVNLITSGTGAAVRDILNVAGRRCPSVPIEILPVKVQGDAAVNEIAAAIKTANALTRCDLIILARGGGSIEDLWAFNTETVAQAIFESDIPIISGVGHEIDFTIADFAADLRAPTPSAAAEMALPDQAALVHRIKTLADTAQRAMARRLAAMAGQVKDYESRLKSPARVMDDYRLRTGELESRLHLAMTQKINRDRERLYWLRRTLNTTLPPSRISEHKNQVAGLQSAMDRAMANKINRLRSSLREASGRLESLNPSSVLARGYSITRDLSSGQVIMDPAQVEKDDRLETILANGRLVTRVE
ncbi:MAG: exodeoxyribonuclease VII large subunit [Desulfobacter sp.]|nr:MAG: exodeoxyribonuclease VII large subunit [Desulfobacter sp.]